MWHVDTVWVSTNDEANRKVSKSFPNPTWEEVTAFLDTLALDCHVEMSIVGPRQYSMGLEGSGDRFIVSTIGEIWAL